MFKKFILPLISVILCIILFVGCNGNIGSNTIGLEYNGTITKSDPFDKDGCYYQKYFIAWASTWEFQFQSNDDILLSLTAYDAFDNEIFSYETSDSLSCLEKLPGGSYVFVKVSGKNFSWAAREYNASYVLKAAIQ